jgi:integrase
MLEASYGLTFFLKTPKKRSNFRLVYLRVTVDGIPKETSTKRKWDTTRWDQETERAIGLKEDARTINLFLDSLVTKINQFKMELMYSDRSITAQKIIDCVKGNLAPRMKVLEEFQLHNDEMKALIPMGEYADGTLTRYTTTRAHVKEFILFKYNMADIEFRELNFQFVKDLEFWLKTNKECNHNTTLKYISNFKKIVLRAIDKEIIQKDPFKAFKAKKNKTNKRPLSSRDLAVLENYQFSTERLSQIRDIFVFQCYTGLAYIDAFQLKRSDIQIGVDGERWIMSERQKTGSETNIPLLPKAIEIMDRYENHPLCLKRDSVLPVKSNQKMNEYLKEIADLCGFVAVLNTHKARRTFGSTVTLNNDVPINVVKEMLGHASVKQTEEYAITEQQTIGRKMKELKEKLSPTALTGSESGLSTLDRLEREIMELKAQFSFPLIKIEKEEDPLQKLQRISEEMLTLREKLQSKAS